MSETQNLLDLCGLMARPENFALRGLAMISALTKDMPEEQRRQYDIPLSGRISQNLKMQIRAGNRELYRNRRQD